MFQDDVPLRVRHRTYTPVSIESTNDQHLFTAVVESLPIALSEGIRIRMKFHAGDASEVVHLWA